MFVSTYSESAPRLPKSLAVVQDGGYFYVFEDEDHANDDERQPLRFVDSGLDPEFGDQAGAERARAVVLEWLAEHEVKFI